LLFDSQPFFCPIFQRLSHSQRLDRAESSTYARTAWTTDPKDNTLARPSAKLITQEQTPADRAQQIDFPSAGTLAGIAENPKDLQASRNTTRPRIASPLRQIVLATSS